MAARFAIGYDVNTKQMRQEGKTKSEVTKFYNEIRKCLNSHGFEKMAQQSVYTCRSDSKNTLVNVFEVIECLREIDNDCCHIKNLHMFKMEDFSDLRPAICHFASEEIDHISNIEAEYDCDESDDDDQEAAPKK